MLFFVVAKLYSITMSEIEKIILKEYNFILYYIWSVKLLLKFD